jgi:hypothetical protein
MTIEKEGELAERDLGTLVKMADKAEKLILYELDEFLEKPAVAVFATGPRAAIIRKLVEEISGG